MKCIVEECSNEGKKRNMCIKHYSKWRKYGDPTISIREQAPRGEGLRFLHEEVIPYKGDECLPWPYGRTNGYGEVFIEGVLHHVHVIVCETVYGARPSPRHVASHKCGNGHLGCVNPRHLKWQTRKEDRTDMVTHKTRIYGSQHVGSVLSEESVLEIRSLEGKLSQRKIAKQFGVDQTTINRIILRKAWSWLK